MAWWPLPSHVCPFRRRSDTASKSDWCSTSGVERCVSLHGHDQDDGISAALNLEKQLD